MPLTDKCKEYIGRNLVVVPYYGHGWGRVDLDVPCRTQEESIGPSQFHVRVDELAYCSGLAMGASGFIAEPNHEFDGHWCGFYLRRTDDCDFVAHLGDYMVWISKTKLQVLPAPEKALYEWVSFDKSSQCLCGYGAVAETVACMGELYTRVMETRKTVLGESA